jgi:uncharacterized membrane protein
MPWLLSLLTLGFFWVARQTQLSHLARSNCDLTWLHLAFLAIITVQPFTTRAAKFRIDFPMDGSSVLMG